MPVRQVVQAAGVIGGTVERSTPEVPLSTKALRRGMRPSAMSGLSTSKVAPSSPMISTRRAKPARSRWPPLPEWVSCVGGGSVIVSKEKTRP